MYIPADANTTVVPALEQEFPSRSWAGWWTPEPGEWGEGLGPLYLEQGSLPGGEPSKLTEGWVLIVAGGITELMA